MSFLERTCRACCRFDPGNFLTLHPIFDGTEPSVAFENIYKEFVLWNLEIKPRDGLPQQMCTECIDRFIQVNIFREELIDSQNLLLSYIIEDINVCDGADISATQVPEENLQTDLVADEFNEFDKIGYNSPIKVMKYVDENESDYLFNHPNEIETHTNSNENTTVVSPKQNEFNGEPKCDDFESLTRTELPNELTRDQNIRCEVCMKFIPSTSKLKRHMQQFHIRKDYVCSICNKKLEQITYRNYYYHMKTHRPKEHKCSFCEKAFFQRIHLLNHERVHTREQPYKCDECGKKYRQEITLQEHKLLHKDPFPWKCNICGKGLKTRSCLLAHMQCHGDGFECEICGARYNQKRSLKKHMLKHTDLGEKIFQCTYCSKSFQKPFQLGNHFNTHHLDNSNIKESYRCTEFKNASDLIKHRSSHDKSERPFTCEVCGKCFMNKIHLESHIDMEHVKQKSFSCMHCHKNFFDVSNLNTHLKIHAGEEQIHYNCNECEKVFSSISSLRLHQSSHSEEKRFKCTFCDKSFKYRNDLGDHVLTHFHDENEDSIFKEVQNDAFENHEEDLNLCNEFKLLDSEIEYSL